MSRVKPGINDLETVNPELAREWHPTKNGDLTPSQVACQSNKSVWWIDSKGHEWKATISSRSSGRGCPYCSGNKVLAGFNDLQTTNPDLAEEWNWARNKELSPASVTAGSNKKVWWIGPCGHEWEATIASRSKIHSGCPYCSNNKVLPGFNDLATRKPECLSWWDYDKNSKDGIEPTNIMPSFLSDVWWKCPAGHSWKQKVNSFGSSALCVGGLPMK